MKLDLKRISVTDGAVIPFSYDADLTKEEMNGEYPFVHRFISKERFGIIWACSDYRHQPAHCMKRNAPAVWLPLKRTLRHSARMFWYRKYRKMTATICT